MFALIHTDDCDMIGDSDEILKAVYDKINSKWKCKLVDARFMLGIRRTIHETPEEMTLTMTMQAFVEAAASAFNQYLIKKPIPTPIPSNTFLSRPIKPNEEEAKYYLNLGYQRLFGMLLWAARGVYPECLAATSMCGRLMVTPTKEAWNCLCHILTYMYQRKTRGIRFSSKGNDFPMTFVDASNKPDPSDGKCQYGYAIKLNNGPVITISKKHAHVGQSAAHNEYMALCMAARHVNWLRDLLTELDLQKMVKGATPMYGDNKAANLLSHEDIVTCGNQFIQLPYHYIKQEVKAGNITVEYIPTNDNEADLMTKAYSKQVSDCLTPRLTGYLQSEYKAQNQQNHLANLDNQQ